MLVFVGVALAAALGFRLHSLALFKTQDDESRSAMRVALGLTSTLTAVVLGLVAASAMNDYERANAMVAGLAIDSLTLDNVLESYGPQTDPIRKEVKAGLRRRIDTISSPDAYAEWDTQSASTASSGGGVEALYTAVAALKPTTDLQERLQTRALDMLGGDLSFGDGNIAQKRWLFSVHPATLPAVFFAVVILWMLLEFFSFGLLSPRSPAVYLSIAAAAIVVTSAIFLIMELDDPLGGHVRVSVEPLKRAIALIG
ncbi:bestrophin-like domain [Mycobacterium sp. NBC_00419]|uniref:bestrophin-like domain n=1 Tax=Mycobacterium sp. NBC_00419 TaxID=2975989 RepID=UPI003FA5E863